MNRDDFCAPDIDSALLMIREYAMRKGLSPRALTDMFSAGIAVYRVGLIWDTASEKRQQLPILADSQAIETVTIQQLPITG